MYVRSDRLAVVGGVGPTSSALKGRMQSETQELALAGRLSQLADARSETA